VTGAPVPLQWSVAELAGDPVVADLVARCAFPPAGTDLVCGVSGGPDSSALLVLAVAAGCRATAVHVDHGLRAGSADESAVVASTAARLGAAFRGVRVDVPDGPNLEARARAARHRALGPGAATGHTMDDQAETVLLNLLRGSGLDGMGAMSPETKPLLGLRRHELRALVAKRGLEVVDDPSNFDLSIRRNLVRQRILPELGAMSRRDLVPVLARQAALARDDAALLDALAFAAVPDYLDVAALRAAPLALRRRRLRDLARDTARDQGDGRHPPSAAEVDRMEAVVLGEAVATELSGGRRLSRSKGRLHVTGA
jgi:tRNA(Ile)-lysidine synthase